jgi:hypothetical protein
MQFSTPFYDGEGSLLAFTIEFWFRPDSLTSQTVFHNQGFVYYCVDDSTSVFSTFDISTKLDGSIDVEASKSDGDCGGPFNFAINSGPNLVNPGQWQHIAFTSQIYPELFSYVNSIYFNGILVATNLTYDLYGFPWPATNPPTLGQGYAGAIGEFREWNRSLSLTEIQTNMNQVLNPTNETGLLAYWRFTEGTNNVVHDLAGTNDGII